MSQQTINSQLPRTLSSPPVFFGYDKYSKKDYIFRDSKGIEHVVSNFEDAKTILFVTYTNIIKSFGLKTDDDIVEKAIKKSPNGSYAYLFLKL